MLKIENRGCHSNGGEDQRITCIVHHSTEIKKQAKFQKNLFFFLFLALNGGSLMSTDYNS